MSDYKESGFEWLGEVPIDWKVNRVVRYFNERKQKVDDISYPPLSVTMSGVTNQLSHVAKSDDGDNRKLVKKDDFVINSRSDRKGSSGIAPRDGSVSLINIVLEPKGLYPSFSQYLFKSYYFIEEYFRNGKGIHFDLWTTGWNKLKNIYISIPPLEKQKLIARYLDKKTEQIDRLVEKIQKKIELLKEQRTSLINQCVTKGLDPTVEMKDTGVEWIGEIPEHWEITRLKYHGQVLIGLSFDKDDMVNEGEGTLVLRSSNVQNGKVTFSDNVYVKTEVPNNLFVQQGDILICSRNGSRNLIGKNCLLGKESLGMTWGVFMSVFRSRNSEFFYWILNSQVFTSQSGLFLTSTINQLTVSTLENLLFPFIPDKTEQNKIIDHLKKETQLIDKLIDKEQRRISLLNEYRQSLVSKVVTGKVHVTEDML